MKAIEIANRYKKDQAVISRIRHGVQHTDDIDLAFDLGRLTGEKPITFIRPKLQKLALAAHPELGKKIKSA